MANQNRRSPEEISSQLKRERKTLYSKKERLSAKFEQMTLTNSTEKQRQRVEKQINTAEKKIEGKNVKLFKYSKKYSQIKQKKRNLESAKKYYFKRATDPTLSNRDRIDALTNVRKTATKIEVLRRTMGIKIHIKKSKMTVSDRSGDGVYSNTVPFWEAQQYFDFLYNPEKYQTADIEGDVISLDSHLSYIFEYDTYIKMVESERFSSGMYHISLEADQKTGVIIATRT